MEAAAIFLAVIGGFLLIDRTLVLQTKYSRMESQRLYFYSALFGFLIFIALQAGYLLYTSKDVIVQALNDPHINLVLMPVEKLIPRGDHLVVLCAVALFVGWLIAFLLNIATFLARTFSKDFFLRYWIRAYGKDELSALFFTSFRQGLPVALALDDGKVYIGFPVTGHDPDAEAGRQYMQLLPLVSGARLSDGRLKLTTYYEDVYEAIAREKHDGKTMTGSGDQEISPDNFILTISVGKISTARLFDFVAYEMFQRKPLKVDLRYA